jgi:mono/diheme cytochrome c family protein
VKRLLVTAALVLLGAGGGWLVWRPETGERRGEALARGAELYALHCAACHGVGLEGAPDWQLPGPNGRLPAPPHDGTGHTWHHGDDLLLRITKYGTAEVVGGGYESDMIGFGDVLSDREIRNVLAFIETHWSDEQRAFQAAMTRREATGR